MKCTQCGDYKATVGDIRACPRCIQPQDGTAALIPAEIADSALLQDAIAVKPGLGNRFLHGDDPANHEPGAQEKVTEEPAASDTETTTPGSPTPEPDAGQASTDKP